MTGSKAVQQNNINWSYRKRGNVPRIQTNKKQKKHVLIAKITDWKLKNDLLSKSSGKW